MSLFMLSRYVGLDTFMPVCKVKSLIIKSHVSPFFAAFQESYATQSCTNANLAFN